MSTQNQGGKDPQQGGTTDKGRQQSQSPEKGTGGSQRSGSGNFANDPERASEAGRKGGEKSHGGSTNK